MLADYYQAASEDPSKLPTQKKMIWEKVCEAKLDHDLEVEEEEAFSDFDKFLEKLHEYLHEMADTQIRDGLHIIGEPPEGSRLDEFLVALTRLANGQVPSFRQSLAEAMGYDYDYLLSNRGRIVSGSKTCGQVIEDFNALALRLVSALHEKGFAVETIPELMNEILGKRNPKIEKVLDYIATTLAPNIDATVDELSAILCASDGGFVSPGPSGAPPGEWRTYCPRDEISTPSIPRPYHLRRPGRWALPRQTPCLSAIWRTRAAIRDPWEWLSGAVPPCGPRETTLPRSSASWAFGRSGRRGAAE